MIDILYRVLIDIFLQSMVVIPSITIGVLVGLIASFVLKRKHKNKKGD